MIPPWEKRSLRVLVVEDEFFISLHIKSCCRCSAMLSSPSPFRPIRP